GRSGVGWDGIGSLKWATSFTRPRPRRRSQCAPAYLTFAAGLDFVPETPPRLPRCQRRLAHSGVRWKFWRTFHLAVDSPIDNLCRGRCNRLCRSVPDWPEFATAPLLRRCRNLAALVAVTE